jgi:hypothetical protein
MSAIRSYLVLTALLFAFITAAHVVRAATGTTVSFDGYSVAPDVSWPLAAVSGALAAWALTCLRALRRP